MRIIYSLNTNNGSTIPGSFFTKMAELSVFSAQQTGYPVELYVDFEGYNYIKTTKCIFDSVHIVDFSKFDYNTAYWNFGKLYTYSIQTEPFLHIDFDVYLHPGFTIPENGDIITEMLREYSYVQAFKDIAVYKVKQIPEKLICSGLIGGYNTLPFVELFEHAQKICKNPINEHKSMSYLVGVEEYNISVIADLYNYSIQELDANYFSHFQGGDKEKRFGPIINNLYTNLIQ